MECSNILIAFHYKSCNMNSIKGILYYIQITYYGHSYIYSMETNLKLLISFIKLTTPKIDYSLILNLEY